MGYTGFSPPNPDDFFPIFHSLRFSPINPVLQIHSSRCPTAVGARPAGLHNQLLVGVMHTGVFLFFFALSFCLREAAC